MQRVMLKSKIHRARVTDANLDYEGSLTIDQNLLEAAEILPYEQIKVYNVSNGARFDTYAIAGAPGSGAICLNGAAARLGARNDLLIIVTYAGYSEAEVACHQPTIVLLNGNNQPVQTPEQSRKPLQAAS
jgi:aspartate 1-decarboxylase